ncbi:MAG: hypothetical protein HUU20_09140 [Pirellulales bacterium]|nr:hypothetical protein [Pirellulales bacterium]
MTPPLASTRGNLRLDVPGVETRGDLRSSRRRGRRPAPSAPWRPAPSARGPVSRAGFSLLEVLLATTILLGCAIVLFELAAVGREHVNSAEQLALAQRVCETRMNEILAGAEPIKAVEKEDVVEHPGWSLSVEVDPVDRQPGLAALRVIVFREADEQHRGRQYALVRWIRDPDYHRAGSSPSDLPASPDTASRAGNFGLLSAPAASERAEP